MANSTDEYWDADGHSLHTYAWALETTNEHMRAAAGLKGTDLPVALRPGEQWSPKVPGSRIITLKGWVRGRDEDGLLPDGVDPSALLNDNYDYIKTLLWQTDRQIALTKRWRTNASGSLGIMAATAHAQYQSGLDNAVVIDQYRRAQALKFTVDMKLADPYFYAAAAATPATTGAFVVKNMGQDTARSVTLSFAGPGSITNHTTGRTMTVAAAGSYDVWNFTAPAGHLKDVTLAGQVQEYFWFTLARGVNNLESTVAVALSYRPVFL